ncbi:MAG: hypothetical protein M3220_02820 [Chloroflexota bacterium]|nr:hypothetical protein [Chloroflexota bacterium]
MSKTMALPQRALARARRAVAKEFPAFRGIRPTVRGQADGRYTLTFRTTVRLPDGGTLRRTLRATISSQGEILRVTTSR